MNFFVPQKPDMQKAEDFYKEVVKITKRNFGYRILANRVFRLRSRHEGATYEYEVGQEEVRNGKPNGDLVFAIIETSGLFLIYTRDRGGRGFEGPILAGPQDVFGAEYFEDFKPS